MTIRAKNFTPEVLLSAPRRSAATPNSDGMLALFTVSTYSFQSHSKSAEIRILDVRSGQSTLLTNDLNSSEPTWLDGCLIVWLQGGEKGVTRLLLGDARTPSHSPEIIATFGGPVANLKILPLDTGKYALALTGQATSSGDLYNPETVEKPHTTGRVYNSLFVRQWDSWVTENTSAIWYGQLTKTEGKYGLTAPGLVNALTGKHGNALKLESPVPPFGGSGDFDLSKAGIVFIAKDPKLNKANYTKTDLYFVPLKSFTEPEPPVPQIVKTGALRGYCGSPVFSPDAKSLAFTRMKSERYESDKPRLLLIPDMEDLANVQEFYESQDGDGSWDCRPESIVWSNDAKELYVTGEEHGRGKLWKLPSLPKHATELPMAIITKGAVNDVKRLAENNSRLFISSTSLIDNSVYSILDPAEPSEIQTISSSSKGGKAFGLSQDQVSEFWYSVNNYDVHALVMRPSNFDKRKKYPLAYLIHGGPQGAWNESWSTRWNPAVFAEQGYIVVTPNPTGSTGYGMAFQNGIKNEWGGRPYVDLVRGFEYIKTHIPYIDTSRAVCLGASYGGFMCNWIQGQPLGRQFKALVTHDGVFSTLNQYSSDELFFPYHDFGGTLWENRVGYEKWDPARFVKNWTTPHLIIHNELDYRLPIGEGLAPFNVLQSLGVPSRFLSFPDENHWVLKPENSLLWHEEVLGWINKYSGIEEEQKLAGKVAELGL